MFFENKNIQTIDKNVDIDELEHYASERALPFHKTDNSTIWNTYAMKYAEEKDMVMSSRCSFSYMISSIFGGMGISCSTEFYFKEEEILDECITALNRLRESSLTEEEIMKELFDFIFILYKDKIEDYTFKTQQVSFKISLPMSEEFVLIEGASKSEKFRNLLKFYRDNHHE